MLKVGIVGLPNVGKSSLFNALTAAGAASENYPFCTVDPNVGTAEVPDPRLDHIHALSGTARRIPTVIQFVDIAGLVEGASEGEGLGNRFLANIREVDAIAHVLRCFDAEDVVHVSGSVDPMRDREIVETELALADLETMERRLERLEKRTKSGDKDAARETAALRKALVALHAGEAARTADLSDEELELLRPYQLLTMKPVLYVANVSESDLPSGSNRWTETLRDSIRGDGHAELVTVCSAVESELAELDTEHRTEFLAALGLEERGLDRFVRAAYDLLGLITFFTTGEHESRAWTVRRGARAPEAAGAIHSDFERGFIRAETVGYETFVEAGTWKGARDRGLLRSEGREYEVRDADIMLFRFNV